MHQSRDQISVQKETTTQPTLISAEFTRSRPKESYVAACPNINRRHVKQIH